MRIYNTLSFPLWALKIIFHDWNKNYNITCYSRQFKSRESKVTEVEVRCPCLTQIGKMLTPEDYDKSPMYVAISRATTMKITQRDMSQTINKSIWNPKKCSSNTQFRGTEERETEEIMKK